MLRVIFTVIILATSSYAGKMDIFYDLKKLIVPSMGIPLSKAESAWTSVKNLKTHYDKRSAELKEKQGVEVSYEDWTKAIAHGYNATMENLFDHDIRKSGRNFAIFNWRQKRTYIVTRDFKLVSSFPRSTPKKKLQKATKQEVESSLHIAKLIDEQGLIVLGLFY